MHTRPVTFYTCYEVNSDVLMQELQKSLWATEMWFLREMLQCYKSLVEQRNQMKQL